MQYLAQHIKWCSLAVMLSMIGSHTAWAQQSAPKPVHKLYKVYDTFNDRLIDPSKWISNYPEPCGIGSALECVREIEDGHLHLRVRNYGSMDNNGPGRGAALGLLLTSPSGVMDLAMEVMVRKVRAEGCPITGANPRGNVGLVGRWFNFPRAESGGQPTEADDVFANLFLETSSDPDVLAVVGHLSRQGGPFFDFPVGEVRVGEWVILGLVWDRPNSRFIARLIRPGHHKAVVEQYMSYDGVDDSIPAVTPLRGLFMPAYVPNCSGTRTFMEMDSLFDNFTVGQ
jgi:hypothetical protein